MATYYVDDANGSDSNAGTGAASGSCWKTITKAEDNVSAGDTVWVAPGLYPENIVLSTNGTSGSIIKWFADVNMQQSWTSVTPGPVAFGNFNSSALWGNTLRFDLNFNQKTYNEFYDFTIIGGVTGNQAKAGQKLFRCVSGSHGGSYPAYRYVECEDCVGIGTTGAFTGCRTGNNGYCKRCVAIGGTNGFYNCTADNCISFAGRYSFGNAGASSNDEIANCASFGGLYIFGTGTQASASGNNLYFCSYSGLQGNNNTPGSLFVCCRYDYVGSPTTSACRGLMGQNPATGLGEGHFMLLPSAKQVINGLSAAFRPRKWRDYDLLDGNSAGTEDIQGRSRTVQGKELGGCWAIPDTSFTTPDKIKITKEGDHLIQFAVPADTQLTISVDAACSLDGGTDYPRIKLNGYGITEQTDTAITTDETLSVTIPANQPDVDTVANLYLMARENNTNAWAEFDNIVVS